MAESVLVTGASGFVGVRMRAALRAAGKRVVGLSRSAVQAPADEGPGAYEHLQGDLLEPAGYRDALGGVDAVIHLAAATGKATEDEHRRINLDGTQALLKACEAAKCQRLIFVSSIAAKFPLKTRYYYAQAKEAAEAAVRASPLADSTTIVRPTIITGPGSPVLAGMAKLAGLPIVPVFGTGESLVQPIDVDDLVALLIAIVEEDLFRGQTVELGGPETLSIGELLQQVRLAEKGSRAKALHLPLGLIIPTLSLMEPVAYKAMPVTVGQLASFRNDGVAAPNPLWEERRERLKTVPQQLARSFSG